VPRFDEMFRQIAVNNAQLRLNDGVAVGIGRDYSRLEPSRARKDRPQIALWQFAAIRLNAVEDEKTVAAGGDAALDSKKIGQGQATAVG
jgi:hypothetical protein